MSNRYAQVTAGEWVQPVRRGYRMRCCDCDLIHVFDFRIHNGRIQIRARRDNRGTSQCRRHWKNGRKRMP